MRTELYGQIGKDRSVRTEWYGQSGKDRVVWTEWYGHGGADRVVRTEWLSGVSQSCQTLLVLLLQNMQIYIDQDFKLCVVISFTKISITISAHTYIHVHTYIYTHARTQII